MSDETSPERPGVPNPGPREYRTADFQPCLEVFDSNVPEFFRVEEREEFTAFLKALPGPYLVVPDATGQVVGCGGYAVPQGTATADLCWGMVRRELHGRGYGRLLTRLRIERAMRDPSVRRIDLNTSQHTVGFYERLGFRTVEVKKDGFAPGLDRHNMQLTVTPPAGPSDQLPG
jgi:ribosomal protein S18 acetylase RimI-like enzyme